MAVVPFDKEAFLARRRELGKKVRGHGLTLNRALHLQHEYGITGYDYARMMKRQGNKCACCGGPFYGKRPVHVDHDHLTGKVRGLTCHGCNLLLGHAKDSIEILRRAISYLKRSAKSSQP